jgi:hypothetical protein
LTQRRQEAGQRVTIAELLQRERLGFLRRHTAGHKLAPTVVEVLRELIDDLALARRGKAQGR